MNKIDEKARLTELLTACPVALYETEHTPENQKDVLALIVHPTAGWTWYIYEAQPCESQSGDWHCFGRVNGLESELGYFYADEVLDTGAQVLSPDEAMIFGFDR